MRKKSKQRFEELFRDNVMSLLKDEKAINRIEQKIDKRHMERLNG